LIEWQKSLRYIAGILHRSRQCPTLLNTNVYCLLLCFTLGHTDLALAHAGQHTQLQRINEVIAQHPEQQALYIQRGLIYSNGGQYEQALADYTRAEQLGPPVAVAHELGVLYYHMGEFDRATKYLDQYLAQFPSSAPAYESRARVARDTGDYERAMADLNKYFELQDAPHPGNYLSATDMLQEMGQTDAALTILEQGMDKLGLTPQLQRRAIALELQRQQPDKAIARLETLRVPLRANPSWKIEMAELLLLQQRRPEAQELLREAHSELTVLRPTPARIELLQRIETLQQPSH
jgi:tetratricopeptide (TPR) repeat protein